ncbi:MAG TPA: hypothetical protein VGD79_02995 [Thermoanaerobaculia bacterium]
MEWLRRRRAAKKEDLVEEADRLLRQAARPPLRAYWLDLLIALGLIGAAFAVWDAARSWRTAAVVVNDVRIGEPIEAGNVVYAPLRVSSRNVTKGEPFQRLVAARNIAAGSLLRRRDVVPRAAPGEVAIPLKIFVGRTPPAVGDRVLLAVGAAQRGDRLVSRARVLSVDASVDPAYVTVAMSPREAIALATIPQPRIQFVQEP